MGRWNGQESPTFQPALRLIQSITNANPAVVTTTFDHDYITGTIIRFHIPEGYGMRQADKLTGEIGVTGTDTFTVDINTTSFDPLVIPGVIPYYIFAYPTVTAIGENNNILTAAVRNVLPDN